MSHLLPRIEIGRKSSSKTEVRTDRRRQCSNILFYHSPLVGFARHLCETLGTKSSIRDSCTTGNFSRISTMKFVDRHIELFQSQFLLGNRWRRLKSAASDIRNRHARRIFPRQVFTMIPNQKLKAVTTMRTHGVKVIHLMKAWPGKSGFRHQKVGNQMDHGQEKSNRVSEDYQSKRSW